jgi:hypothetical protein
MTTTPPNPPHINLTGLLRRPTKVRRARAMPPPVICIDSREQQPFTFAGLRAEVRFEFLGDGQGDYTLDGMRGLISIERKNLADAHGTFCSYGDRRRQFETELDALNRMEFAAIVVEATFETVLQTVWQWGVKSIQANRKTLYSSVLSWQQRFPHIHWQWCESREFAERFTFDHLKRFWEHKYRTLRRFRRTHQLPLHESVVRTRSFTLIEHDERVAELEKENEQLRAKLEACYANK